MSTSNKLYCINEYGSFTRGIEVPGYTHLPEKTFDALEEFIFANTQESETEAVELLSLSVRRNVGKIITARNYVGLITMSDGTVIEILPKIANKHIAKEETKRIFLEMLKSLKDINFKDFNVSNLQTERMNLLEIFIKMFLDEVAIIAKQGLKSAYIPVEANETFYKGKLLASQNIKYNLVNKERFFVRYDDFNIDRAENRLIKSTLRLLLKTTNNVRNHRQADRLLRYFDRVNYSINYNTDFSCCVMDRSISHYDKTLSWCRIFLQGNSFTAFAGSKIAIALLFPMEKIFEDFVAAKFRRHLKSGMSLRIQDAGHHLFDSPRRAFALRPDIVLEIADSTMVLDTKWKLLRDNVTNQGISQADMYQMYAYSKKYQADKIILLYPQTDVLTNQDIKFSSDDDVEVEACFVDLRNPDESIVRLLNNLSNPVKWRERDETKLLYRGPLTNIRQS